MLLTVALENGIHSIAQCNLQITNYSTTSHEIVTLSLCRSVSPGLYSFPFHDLFRSLVIQCVLLLYSMNNAWVNRVYLTHISRMHNQFKLHLMATDASTKRRLTNNKRIIRCMRVSLGFFVTSKLCLIYWFWGACMLSRLDKLRLKVGYWPVSERIHSLRVKSGCCLWMYQHVVDNHFHSDVPCSCLTAFNDREDAMN